ncbi:MAG: PLP-dependent aminotransferase family protein [Desulfobacterales bacterium]|nr:PLP-dependent aminotransferase family protein [Desulfobacterales bacterium]
MTIWKPDLENRAGPKYRRIIEAIADDIASGALPPGTRLPPHRILAYELNISPHTTSRAYAHCVARGMLQGQIGRGTFVRMVQPDSALASPGNLERPVEGPIDFSKNLPFPGVGANHLSQTLKELGRSSDLEAYLDYQVGHSHGHQLDAGVSWLARTGIRASRDDVVLTCGAQHGILSALMATARPGDLLLTEELTYAPVSLMARHLGLPLATVIMDDKGICPEALNEVCQKQRPKVLYITPTIQTPTTITLDTKRRAEIAEIVLRHNLILIEDDVYGPLRSTPMLPIAELAPERTIYISSTSKCLAPGLRTAFLKAPDLIARGLRSAVALSCWMPPPLMAEITCRWITDGTADLLTRAQRTEANKRQAMATDILADATLKSDPDGFHIWLSLPVQWSPSAFCARASQKGVQLTAGETFSPDEICRTKEVRISLSHEPSRKRVKNGLYILLKLLKVSDQMGPLVI